MTDQQPHRIVIVGGGAGGLELATALGDKFGRGDKARITLVDRSRTHIWKPLLHSIAAGSLRRSQHELNYMAQAHWHHFHYRLGEMTGLDRDARTIKLAPVQDDEGREVSPEASIGFDTLVIAVGSVTNDFGTPGAKEFAVPLETPEQASRFNRRLVNACLRAQHQSTPVTPGQLHVAIIGAGATGTELAAELHHTAREIIAYGLDKIDPEHDLKIVLIEATPRILPALPERISAATLALLQELGVEVRTGARVAEVLADGVRLADGELIPSELVVWSAGVKAPDFLHEIGGLETSRINQLVVRQTLQTSRDDAIFALGDCAACARPGFEQNIPPRAQAAHQQAEFMIAQLSRLIEGEPLQDFVYKDFGSLVSLGKFSTVGNLMGFVVGRSFMIEGYFARFMYRSLYKMHEAALHGRGRTLLGLFSSSARPAPTVKLH
ncbi:MULTISPECIES: NAD(P)/FAD-dependent oxidoreductase [Rhodopseudomonas]|uniref:Pyridine nucleotide-disulfide oxidoreductase n=1 Tax=Rhodopseudomonas palustris TaxID=1076 RepID=A0A0D7EHU6_RHOPL|nr:MULTISPECIES: NAD(P)/FAD-dependent oxidoreductase [Rhodopseudomonas]KIZ40399.1 pyridine nucleotide-disulfide oxidoreductase [Rhodopseudomonas palustris]MDF3810358.1 NAD(P)/FAD-dependent oxidoreductase [Rhodopseudomonas sp. BAL398]WOK17378.1 NAD(P)/FAD-dependent oxidoreductase [Rhodopseudomonas sp. BAL398]